MDIKDHPCERKSVLVDCVLHDKILILCSLSLLLPMAFKLTVYRYTQYNIKADLLPVQLFFTYKSVHLDIHTQVSRQTVTLHLQLISSLTEKDHRCMNH